MRRFVGSTARDQWILFVLGRGARCRTRRDLRCLKSSVFANADFVAQLGAVLRAKLFEVEINRLLNRSGALLLAEFDWDRREFYGLLLVAFLIDDQFGGADSHVVCGRERNLD